MCDLENLVNEEVIAHVGLQRHVKKKFTPILAPSLENRAAPLLHVSPHLHVFKLNPTVAKGTVSNGLWLWNYVLEGSR
jgi:hypothetical protein